MEPIRSHLPGTRNREPAAGCNRCTEKQVNVSANYAIADDFLRKVWYPLSAESLPDSTAISKTEKTFFQSVNHFNNLYGCQIERSELPYPLNVCETFEQCRTKMQQRDKDLEVILFETKQDIIIGTTRTLDTGYNLYYIPLFSLAACLRRPDKKRLADLLLSCFSYLHAVGVTLCNEYSFVGGEMIALREDMPETYHDWEDKEVYKQTYREAGDIINKCKRISKMISRKENLETFGKRLKSFTPENSEEQQVVNAIADIYRLHLQFPESTFLQQINSIRRKEDHCDVICMEQYLSFYWGGNSFFERNVNDNINIYLQEIMAAEEPVSVQLFDVAHTCTTHNLEFEKQLLECIIELNNTLYELPTC